ncbi:hypothetical protein D3C71_2049060 [compost metagenome]
MQALPPTRIEQFAVLLAHDILQCFRQPHEQAKTLREYIIGRDVEPGFAGHGFLLTAWLRPCAEIAFSEQAQFIVVVEHCTAMP